MTQTRSLNAMHAHKTKKILPVLYFLLGDYPASAQQQGGGGHLRGSGAHAQQQVAAARAQRRPQRRHSAQQPCMQAQKPMQLTALSERSSIAASTQRKAALHTGCR